MLYQSDIETMWDLVQKLLLDADVEVGGPLQHSTAHPLHTLRHHLGLLLLWIGIPQHHKQQRTATVWFYQHFTSCRPSQCPVLVA
jgi:hypothetical protein